MPRLMRRWGVSGLDAYLDALLVHKTSPNGVFGAKVHWGQYDPLLAGRDPAALFPNPRFIHISRGDRLRQAISWVRAMQTLRWKSSEQGRAGDEVRFDADDIRAKLRRIEGDESRWRALFERHGIAPLEVEYESLAERPERTVGEVLRWFGIDAPAAAPGQARLRRQSDAISEEWARRFLAQEPPQPG
jgi:LPS sulfotransferase NodH